MKTAKKGRNNLLPHHSMELLLLSIAQNVIGNDMRSLLVSKLLAILNGGILDVGTKKAAVLS